MIKILLFFLGLGYKSTRSLAISLVFTKQKLCNQAQDLEPIVEWGEEKLLALFNLYKRLLFTYSNSQSLKTNFCGLEFSSPVTVAAYQGNLKMIELFLSLGAGGACLKTTMLQARVGNPKPRLIPYRYQGQSALLNALGLPGKGIDVFLESLDDFDLASQPIGISIGGHSDQEYFAVFKKVVQYLEAKSLDNIYIELNVSCPNTETGQLLLENISKVENLLCLFRKHSSIPLSIKLAPFLKNEQFIEYAQLSKKYERVFLNCGNTLPVKSDQISVGKGGLSGRALLARNIEIAKCLQAYQVPLMITGGVSAVEDIILLRKYGVKIVGLATALIENPFIIPQINKALASTK